MEVDVLDELVLDEVELDALEVLEVDVDMVEEEPMAELEQFVVVPTVVELNADPLPTATPLIVNEQVEEYSVVVATWLNGL